MVRIALGPSDASSTGSSVESVEWKDASESSLLLLMRSILVARRRFKDLAPRRAGMAARAVDIRCFPLDLDKGSSSLETSNIESSRSRSLRSSESEISIEIFCLDSAALSSSKAAEAAISASISISDGGPSSESGITLLFFARRPGALEMVSARSLLAGLRGMGLQIIPPDLGLHCKCFGTPFG